jgi:hypothetical protein
MSPWGADAGSRLSNSHVERMGLAVQRRGNERQLVAAVQFTHEGGQHAADKRGEGLLLDPRGSG